MALPFALRPEDVPAHRLFPEAYETTKRQVVRDFLFFGIYIAGSIVGLAFVFG